MTNSDSYFSAVSVSKRDVNTDNLRKFRFELFQISPKKSQFPSEFHRISQKPRIQETIRIWLYIARHFVKIINFLAAFLFWARINNRMPTERNKRESKPDNVLSSYKEDNSRNGNSALKLEEFITKFACQSVNHFG